MAFTAMIGLHRAELVCSSLRLRRELCLLRNSATEENVSTLHRRRPTNRNTLSVTIGDLDNRMPRWTALRTGGTPFVVTECTTLNHFIYLTERTINTTQPVTWCQTTRAAITYQLVLRHIARTEIGASGLNQVGGFDVSSLEHVESAR